MTFSINVVKPMNRKPGIQENYFSNLSIFTKIFNLKEIMSDFVRKVGYLKVTENTKKVKSKISCMLLSQKGI